MRQPVCAAPNNLLHIQFQHICASYTIYGWEERVEGMGVTDNCAKARAVHTSQCCLKSHLDNIPSFSLTMKLKPFTFDDILGVSTTLAPPTSTTTTAPPTTTTMSTTAAPPPPPPLPTTPIHGTIPSEATTSTTQNPLLGWLPGGSQTSDIDIGAGSAFDSGSAYIPEDDDDHGFKDWIKGGVENYFKISFSTTIIVILVVLFIVVVGGFALYCYCCYCKCRKCKKVTSDIQEGNFENIPLRIIF